MKIGSLFAGIGGFDLAGEWCGHRTIWTSEIDPYCVALLAERFPAAKQLGDISAIDWATVERPDILTGGFPCQDISYAGKGAGLAGKRSGLWYEYARAIREVGPRYVIVENVRALFTRGFDAVLGTLADLGYDAEWAMYGAADVGAPHRRERVWILGYPASEGFQNWRGSSVGRPAAFTQPQRPGGGDVAYAIGGDAQAGRERLGGVRGEGAGIRLSGDAASGGEALAYAVGERGRSGNDSREDAADADARRERVGPRDYGEWWAVEPNVGRVAYGVPARVDRLRGLGNAIVPACALPIYGRIAELEGQRMMREAA